MQLKFPARLILLLLLTFREFRMQSYHVSSMTTTPPIPKLPILLVLLLLLRKRQSGTVVVVFFSLITIMWMIRLLMLPIAGLDLLLWYVDSIMFFLRAYRSTLWLSLL